MDGPLGMFFQRFFLVRFLDCWNLSMWGCMDFTLMTPSQFVLIYLEITGGELIRRGMLQYWSKVSFFNFLSFDSHIIPYHCMLLLTYEKLYFFYSDNSRSYVKGTKISRYQKIASFGIIWHTNDSVIVQSRLSGIIRAGSPLQRALWRQLRWNECVTRTSTVSGPDQQSGKVGLDLPDCWTDIAANAYHWHVNFSMYVNLCVSPSVNLSVAVSSVCVSEYLCEWLWECVHFWN